jgi:formylglycine-generating enzyme required for sulfatase activity
MLVRLDLELPTEAQWEVAARGNTTTPWWTGEDPESLRGAANLADLSYVRFYGPSDAAHDGWNDDGFGATAPVGSFRPNAFGLHDTLGNVWEWCRDGFGDYSEKAAPGDGYRPGDPRYPVYRGGCFDNPAIKARSAARACQVPDPGNGYMGVRPARRVR